MGWAPEASGVWVRREGEVNQRDIISPAHAADRGENCQRKPRGEVASAWAGRRQLGSYSARAIRKLNFSPCLVEAKQVA